MVGRSHIAITFAAAAAVALGLTAAVGAQSAPNIPLPARFAAVAVDMDRGVQTPIRITITNWSSNAERDRLLSTLMSQGPQKLLDELQKAPKVGTIGTTTSLAWDLHYAQASPGEEGGAHIVLGTDRPISFSEQWRQSRTLDYPFEIVELHLNRDLEGDGTLSYATKIIPDREKHSIVLENWGTQRIRLNQVHPEKGTD
jgi:hypothetical protein